MTFFLVFIPSVNRVKDLFFTRYFTLRGRLPAACNRSRFPRKGRGSSYVSSKLYDGAVFLWFHSSALKDKAL